MILQKRSKWGMRTYGSQRDAQIDVAVPIPRSMRVDATESKESTHSQSKCDNSCTPPFSHTSTTTQPQSRHRSRSCRRVGPSVAWHDTSSCSHNHVMLDTSHSRYTTAPRTWTSFILWQIWINKPAPAIWRLPCLIFKFLIEKARAIVAAQSHDTGAYFINHLLNFVGSVHRIV